VGRPFDLPFVAASMSLMDGIELAEHLKKHPREFARMILMVDPKHAKRDLPRARATGIATHVAKPLIRQAIAGAITAALNVSSAALPPAEVETRAHRRFRILLAEDTADVGWIIRTMVEGADYQVDLAADGGIAADLFRMVGYDLVLMDLQMPGFDGYQAAREIRNWEHAKGLKRTPIIAVTAFAQERPEKAFATGFDGYLLKPFEKQTLLKLIASHLEHPPMASPIAGRG
jgi:CheY-like chemotaxis protein